MSEIIFILFCQSPLQENKVDEDFEEEFLFAKRNGFCTIFFSFEDLTSLDRFSVATRKIKPVDKLAKVIYRGWMLTPKQYSILYESLMAKNYQLINSVEEYQKCHYLPDSLQYITDKTPTTVFEKYDNEESILLLIDKTKIFGQKPVIVKDYVKSEKHHWKTACFVEDVSDGDNLTKTINNLLNLRGSHLNEGIVVREFIELNDLSIHSKSKMPLAEEYRLFFCFKKLLAIYNYWEEGEYSFAIPDTTEFEQLAEKIPSNFFSMDIARRKDGELIIIELGDGQVSGLPETSNKNEFYGQLKKVLELNNF